MALANKILAEAIGFAVFAECLVERIIVSAFACFSIATVEIFEQMCLKMPALTSIAGLSVGPSVVLYTVDKQLVHLCMVT